jgi:hypothetical protein
MPVNIDVSKTNVKKEGSQIQIDNSPSSKSDQSIDFEIQKNQKSNVNISIQPATALEK